MLMTEVAKFMKLSVFSALNNIVDISQDDLYSNGTSWNCRICVDDGTAETEPVVRTGQMTMFILCCADSLQSAFPKCIP